MLSVVEGKWFRHHRTCRVRAQEWDRAMEREAAEDLCLREVGMLRALRHRLRAWAVVGVMRVRVGLQAAG